MKVTFQRLMLWLRGEQQRKEDGDPYTPPPWRDQPSVIDAPEPAKPTPTAAENREAARRLRIAAEARRRDAEVEKASRAVLKPPGRTPAEMPRFPRFGSGASHMSITKRGPGDYSSSGLDSVGPLGALNPASPLYVGNSTGSSSSDTGSSYSGSCDSGSSSSSSSDSGSCGGGGGD